MRRHLTAIAVILTVATGCDNVAWGGAEIELRSPSANLVLDSVEAVEPEAVQVPPAPLLLAGTRTGSRATLAVVGEIREGALLEIEPDSLGSDPERGRPALGSQWVLFSGGARVGRMTVDGITRDDSFCSPRVSVSGPVELLPAASDVGPLLALSDSVAGSREPTQYRALTHNYNQRVASLNLAGTAMSRVGAAWPPNGLVDARKDIQVFDLPGSPRPFVAATFLYRDALDLNPPQRRGYSLFLIARQDEDGFREEFSWYRAADEEGKGVPRYLDHVDWDGDGVDEILLDVLGDGRRWYAAVESGEGTWARTFQDACGTPGTPLAR